MTARFTRVSEEPLVYECPNFLSPEECVGLIDLGSRASSALS